jgi:hypothetical protein
MCCNRRSGLNPKGLPKASIVDSPTSLQLDTNDKEALEGLTSSALAYNFRQTGSRTAAISVTPPVLRHQ